MILADELFQLNVSKEFMEMFLVVIQFGSILAVVFLYFHKLNPFSPKKTKIEKGETWSLWFKVLVATIPAGVIGLLFDDVIHDLFYNLYRSLLRSLFTVFSSYGWKTGTSGRK